MKISCNNCGATYPIPDQRIPAQGLNIKCPRCMSPIRIPGSQSVAPAPAQPLQFAAIPDAEDSGEHPLPTLRKRPTSSQSATGRFGGSAGRPEEVEVDLDGDAELPAPSDGEFDLPVPSVGELDLPAPSFGAVDLPAPSAGELDLPAPLVGDEEWDQTEEADASDAEEGLADLPAPGAGHLDLPARLDDEAELPYPVDVALRPPPDFSADVDLLAPTGEEPDLLQPLGGWSRGQAIGMEEDQVDLLAPLDQTMDLPAPIREEDSSDWAERNIRMEAADPDEDWVDATAPTAIGIRSRDEADATGIPMDSGEFSLPARPGGTFRVQGRKGAEAEVDLDQTHLPQEQLQRPEFVPRDTPQLSEEPDFPAAAARRSRPDLLRIGLLFLLLLLGAGSASGFTTWGLFATKLLAEPEAESDGQTSNRQEFATGRGSTLPGGASAGAAAGSGAASDESAGPSSAAVSFVGGIPQTDSYSGYVRALADMRKKLSRATDRDRCAFALTAAYHMLRYGREDALEGEARKALDATSGDTDETSEYQLAEIGLDLLGTKTDGVEERLGKILAKNAENVDALLLRAEFLISRKDYAPAIQSLRQAMMIRSGDQRVTYSLARAQQLDGKTQEARQRMEEVLKLNDEHPFALLAMAEDLKQREQYQEAVKLLRRITDEKVPLGPKLLLARAHIAAADLLVRQGKSDDAVRELNQALAQNAGDIDVLMELGNLYFQRGQYEQAQTQYETINSLGKPNLDAHIGIIKSLLAMRKLSQANEAIVAARRTWNDHAQLSYYQGVVHEERGKFDKAREEYQNALTLDPHYFFPTIKLARLFLREGKQDEALKSMLKAVKDNPKAPVLHDGLGELYMTLNDINKAKKSFQKALELDPMLHSARFHLATALINLGEFNLALEHLLKVQASGNTSLDLHYGLARTYQALKKYDLASEEYNTVLALDQDNDEYAFAAGTAYFEQEEYEKARQRFNQALTLNSRIHRAHFLTGMSYLRENNPVQAEKRMRIAVEDFRESLEYAFWLAVTLEMQNKNSEAREIYVGIESVTNRAPERIKEVPDLYFRLGRNILLAGEPGKAAIYLSRAINRKEKRAEPWYMAGEAFYQLNMYDKAMNYFEEAVRLKRDYPDAHYKIAMGALLQATPNRMKAIEHFREVINFDKQHRHVDAYKHLGFLYRDGGQNSEAINMLSNYLRYTAANAPDRMEVRREIEALGNPRGNIARVPPPPGKPRPKPPEPRNPQPEPED